MADTVNINAAVRQIERNRRLSLGLPVDAIRAEIPIGYKRSEADPLKLVAIPEHYSLLLQARKYLNDSSYKDVAAWLTKAGLPISHNGLHLLMKARPPYTDDERQRFTSSSEAEKGSQQKD